MNASNVAITIATVTYMLCGVIILLLMVRMICCDCRRNGADTQRSDTLLAILTSVCSIAMCSSYGAYFLYDLIPDDGHNKNNIADTLSGHLPFIPHLVSVTFRSLAIGLFLSHHLVKLHRKYHENDDTSVGNCAISCLAVLVVIACIFSIAGVFLDEYDSDGKMDWYYFTNSAAFGIPILVVCCTGVSLYLRLQKMQDNIITINSEKMNTTPSQESGTPATTRGQNDIIYNLSKQIVLLSVQCLSMICGFGVEIAVYVYFYETQTQNEKHYLTFPCEVVSFCLIVIIINVTIWLSLEFASELYQKRMCFGCCHDCLADRIRAIVMLGKPGKTVQYWNVNENNDDNNYYRSRDDGVPIDRVKYSLDSGPDVNNVDQKHAYTDSLGGTSDHTLRSSDGTSVVSVGINEAVASSFN